MGLVSHIKQMLEDRLQEGGPAGLGYRVAWATAARELGRPVSKEELEAAIAGLVRDNVLAGRQVGSERALVLRSCQPKATRESLLMPDVEEWLQTWLLEQTIDDADIIDRAVENTSRSNVRGAGPNANPDFLSAFICERPTRLRSRFLEAVSFELKAADANINTAAQEAAQHHNYVHRSYLVWHVDGRVTPRDRIAALAKACKIQDIGLIIFEAADDVGSYCIEWESPRREPDALLTEQFLQERLSSQVFNRLVGEGRSDVG